MKRFLAGVVLGAMLMGGQAAIAATSHHTAASVTAKADTYHGARYALQEDLWGFMFTARWRHCSNPAPKTLTRVAYRPADSFVAYRCES